MGLCNGSVPGRDKIKKEKEENSTQTPGGHDPGGGGERLPYSVRSLTEAKYLSWGWGITFPDDLGGSVGVPLYTVEGFLHAYLNVPMEL